MLPFIPPFGNMNTLEINLAFGLVKIVTRKRGKENKNTICEHSSKENVTRIILVRYMKVTPLPNPLTILSHNTMVDYLNCPCDPSRNSIDTFTRRGRDTYLVNHGISNGLVRCVKIN